MRRIVMKKIYLILALVFMMSLSAFAQHNDGFFRYEEEPYNRLNETVDIGLYVPTQILGSGQNETAPVGSGLLILTAVGIGYAIRKRKK